MQKLPIKLGKEPLIEVMFELRFKSAIPGSYFLPGVIASSLGESIGALERLPTSNIPQEIRDAERQLAFVPLIRFPWDHFVILIGDCSVGVACKLPYVGWAKFKAAIERVTSVVLDEALVQKVVRHGIKYVDFIETEKPTLSGELVNLDISLGGQKLSDEAVQFRTEVREQSHIKIIQVVSPALAKRDGKDQPGTVIDIDVVRPLDDFDIAIYRKNLPDLLDEVHRINKSTFFSCLTVQALTSLEPSYA